MRNGCTVVLATLAVFAFVLPNQANAKKRSRTKPVPTVEPTPPPPEEPAVKVEDLLPKDGRPSVYVMHPKLSGLPGELLGAITGTIARACVEEGVAVLTQGDAMTILKTAQDMMSLGADADGSALAVLGQKMGTGHMLATQVSSVDGDVLVQMRLIHSEKGEVLARREAKVSEHDGALMTTVEQTTRLVLNPIFGNLKGKLSLQVSEEGASVSLDGLLLGTSPLGVIETTGGSHLLTVNKDGFVVHKEQVRVAEEDVVQRMIRLRPSQAFIRDYRAKNKLYRTLAWGTTGGAGALLLGGIAAGLGKISQDAESIRLAEQFNALPPSERTPNNAADTQSRITDSENSANALGTAFMTLTSLAIVSGATSAYFWLFGEDPDRYQDFSGEGG